MPDFTLDQLLPNMPAHITGITAAMLNPSESRRLVEFGFEVGAEVELLHRAGLFARDPIAVRVGRMTVAVRRTVAASIQVAPL